MDLEDAVALSQKETARHTVVESLLNLDFGRSERVIRINPLNTDFFNDDLRATVDARPDGYVIPKVETPDHVQAVSQCLDEAEARRGWPQGTIRLLVLIETAKGVMNLDAIAQASQRLEALLFGAEDFVVDLGVQRSRDGWEVFYARSAVVTVAAAYELQAIDTVFVDLHDLAGLEAECEFVRQLGFEGKMAIHPRQVEIINRVFAPSSTEIERALRLVQAFAEHESSGSGVFEIDGKMVDMPVVRAAERLLEKARRAGMLIE